MKAILLALALLCACSASPADAGTLRVATWNLGWHLSGAEADVWIARCGAPFKEDETGFWRPAESGTPGWELEWGRDARIEWDLSSLPPCNVFRVNFDTVAVTLPSYQQRLSQIRSFIRDSLNADVIAFQEVSGEQAVRDVLPDHGQDYNVCSYSTHKIQRLAFAWRKSLGGAGVCETEDTLSLPDVPEKDRVRPGLAMELTIDGKLVRFLNVHLKSSCVSPLESEQGILSGPADACRLLQRQIIPLEAWIEKSAAVTRRFVVLGDFNRNVWHERTDSSSVRTDGSRPTTPLPAGVLVQSAIEEIDDGAPASSLFVLLHEECPVNRYAELACEDAERGPLPAGDKRMLGHSENLGCQFPVGLDHILVGNGFAVTENAIKIPLGVRGRTLPSSADHPDPLLSLSDHCPTMTTLNLD